METILFRRTNTDRLLLNIIKIIFDNPYYIIFDNVLSRFNEDIVEMIIELCRKNNITIILLEQNNIKNKKIDYIINLDEETEYKNKICY